MPQKKLRGRPPNDPDATKEALLNAAAKLFNADGYFGTDSNKIARAAGFAPATFYRHFRDKKQVFLAAYAYWVTEDWEVIEASIKGAKDSAGIARLLVESYESHHRQWGSFRRSMHALVATDEEARAFHIKVRAAQLDRLDALLRQMGAPARPREDLLFRFLSIERAANALTDDDLPVLGTSAARLRSRIQQAVQELLMHKRSPR